jgi:Asp-tRNA(Asn)/Glu-tRNA(Gln) amidotransferase A subunit family amidase
MPELHRLGAREAARRIEDGSLTPEGLARACLDRIAEREPTVKAWEFLEEKTALGNARAAASGPLRGVPVGVKDIIDTADMPTGCGSPIWAGHRPRADASVVALTRGAGGVVLGKTVTTEFATFHPGKTGNPHDPTRTPGGSSSGSAAAVADFHVPLAFGTQTAGSVIRPAAFCGVVGYKPSFGTLHRVGVKPLSETLDTVGVMARSVEDAAFFMGVLARRPALVDLPRPEKPRIGFCRTPMWEKAEPSTQKLLEELASRLGAREVASPPEHAPLVEAQQTIMARETADALAWEHANHGEKLSQRLREVIAAGLAADPGAYDAAKAAAEAARLRLSAFFGEFDAILVPSAPGEAPKGLGATGDPLFNRPWTLLGVPCVTVPAGKGPNGMPLGAQLVGRIGDDARLLAAAGWVERTLAG